MLGSQSAICGVLERGMGPSGVVEVWFRGGSEVHVVVESSSVDGSSRFILAQSMLPPFSSYEHDSRRGAVRCGDMPALLNVVYRVRSPSTLRR